VDAFDRSNSAWMIVLEIARRNAPASELVTHANQILAEAAARVLNPAF
jgi:hypothetical protein